MGLLDRIMGKERTPAQETAIIAAVADAKGAPGTRIHHEFFVNAADNDRHVWLCRVYDADGTAHEMSGTEFTDANARNAAITWAEATKATLRRAA